MTLGYRLSALALLLAVIAATSLAAADGGEKSAPALSMRVTAGFLPIVGGQIIEEAVIQANGDFTWTRKKLVKAEDGTGWTVQESTASGTVPAKKLAALIEGMASAAEGPSVIDAGSVDFTWTAADGGKGSRSYSAPDQGPCKGLVERVRKLLAANEKPADQKP